MAKNQGMNRLLVPFLAVLLLGATQSARAARLSFEKGDLSFEAPRGFQKVTVPGFLWCGRTPSGERVSVQLWRRKTGLTALDAVSSERLYPRLHRYHPVRIVKRGRTAELQGAPASLVTVERKQDGKLYRSYQVVALEQGDLYVFEYTAPTTAAEKGVSTFTQLLASVRWHGKPAEPIRPVAAIAVPTSTVAPTSGAK